MRALGIGVAAVAAAALLASGCGSTYGAAYQEETEKLEAQEAARQRAEEAAHAEAQKYAAVVYFATGSDAITTEGERELHWFVEKMQPYPQATFQVNGFADATGSEGANQRLSGMRAEAVAEALVNLGIDRSRIVTGSFASQYPAASNVTAKGRADNRRVEVTVR